MLPVHGIFKFLNPRNMWFEFASLHVVVLTLFTKNDFCLVATSWTFEFCTLGYPPPKRIAAPSPKRLTFVRNSQENPSSEVLKMHKNNSSDKKKAIIRVFVYLTVPGALIPFTIISPKHFKIIFHFIMEIPITHGDLVSCL